jgi:GrpB-like predicted nucleotidyltransferase (UPF0157 family)
MVAFGDAGWWERLLFRDDLRGHPDAAESQAALKRDLAGRGRDDRGRYAAGKAAFIEGVLRLAKAESPDS